MHDYKDAGSGLADLEVFHEYGDDDVDEYKLRHQHEDNEEDGSHDRADAAVVHALGARVAVVIITQCVLDTQTHQHTDGHAVITTTITSSSSSSSTTTGLTQQLYTQSVLASQSSRSVSCNSINTTHAVMRDNTVLPASLRP